MANALRLYRAVAISANDPEGLGRVQLGITRTIRKSPVQDEGWVNVAASPLGASAEIRPLYAVGDSVLYAAERLPFVGAVVIGRETTNSTSTSVHDFVLMLGQGNEMKIEAVNGALRVSTTAGQQVTLNAGRTIDVFASEISLRANKMAVAAAMVTIDSGMVQFSGTVKCDTLIANSVVSASYTPGAGNIW